MATPFLMPDISHHQGHHTADDMKRAAGVADAIMFKATEGQSFVDDEFVSNAAAANAAGLPWGAYHFTRPGTAAAEAQHFLNVITRVPGCRFLLLDWEDGGRELVRNMLAWLHDNTDMPVGDYIGSHARSKGGQLKFADFHMVPQYGPTNVSPEFRTDPLSAWQYTNGEINGTPWPKAIPGIGPCDVSAVFRPQDFGFGEDDMTPDELLTALESPRGQRLIRRAVLFADATPNNPDDERTILTLLHDAADEGEVIAKLVAVEGELVEEIRAAAVGEADAEEVATRVIRKLADALATT